MMTWTLLLAVPPGSFSDHYVMGKMEIDLALLEDCGEPQI